MTTSGSAPWLVENWGRMPMPLVWCMMESFHGEVLRVFKAKKDTPPGSRTPRNGMLNIENPLC